MKARQLRLLRKFYGIPLRKQHEILPPHVIEGIRQGRADFEAGRFITFDEFKRKHLKM